MNYAEEIKALEAEWAPEDGFFWRVRQGQFATSDFERALARVSAIEFDETAELPRRIVSLLWFIPLFMEWQMERVQENKGDEVAYTEAITTMTNEIMRLLGTP